MPFPTLILTFLILTVVIAPFAEKIGAVVVLVWVATLNTIWTVALALCMLMYGYNGEDSQPPRDDMFAACIIHAVLMVCCFLAAGGTALYRAGVAKGQGKR